MKSLRYRNNPTKSMEYISVTTPKALSQHSHRSNNRHDSDSISQSLSQSLNVDGESSVFIQSTDVSLKESVNNDENEREEEEGLTDSIPPSSAPRMSRNNSRGRQLMGSSGSREIILLDSQGNSKPITPYTHYNMHDNIFHLNEALKAEVNNLTYQLEIERSKMKPQKVVSGSQFRLPLKVDTIQRCVSCDNTDKALKRARETIRTLKLQLLRAEDALLGLKKTTNTMGLGGNTMSNSPLQIKQLGHSVQGHDEYHNLIRYNQELQDRIDQLENDIDKFRSRNNSADLEKAMEELKVANSKEVNELKRLLSTANDAFFNQQKVKAEDDVQISRLKVQLQAAKTHSERNEVKISELINRINELELSLETASHTDTTDMYQKELAAKESMVKSLQKQLEDALSNASNITTKFNHLDLVYKNAVAENQKAQAEYTGLNALFTPLKAKCDDYELKLKVSDKDKLNLLNTIEDVRRELNDEKNNNAYLNSEVERLNGLKSDLTKRLQRESDNSRKSIETSIASSVRLCVVAPTVNVTVASSKIKAKASLNEKALKTFLTTEVLSKYSFLFKQQDEESSPVEKEPLQVWIQKMLNNMQQSIEDHVNNALTNAS